MVWCAHGDSGQGAKGNNDVGVVRECGYSGCEGKVMIGLQGMITGMVGDGSVLVWSRKTLWREHEHALA